MHIMDILQNSIRAGATEISLEILEDTLQNIFRFNISDNGCGIPPDILKMVADPFFTTRTTRKVGLGLSLLRQNAERSNGSLSIDSKVGKGTVVEACFEYNHIDRPVLGDIAGTVLLTLTAHPEINFHYLHNRDGRSFELSTAALTEALGGIPINEPSLYPTLLQMVKENLKDINVN